MESFGHYLLSQFWHLFAIERYFFQLTIFRSRMQRGPSNATCRSVIPSFILASMLALFVTEKELFQVDHFLKLNVEVSIHHVLGFQCLLLFPINIGQFQSDHNLQPIEVVSIHYYRWFQCLPLFTPLAAQFQDVPLLKPNVMVFFPDYLLIQGLLLFQAKR